MSEFQEDSQHMGEDECEEYDYDYEEEEGTYEYKESSNVELSEFEKKNQPLNSVELLQMKKRFEAKDQQLRDEKRAATTAHSIEGVGKVNKSNCFSSGISFQILFNEYSLIKTEPNPDFCIEVLNDNLYHWKIYMRNFNYETPFGYDMIEKDIEELVMEIEFVQDLYPFYPPRVTIISPRLKDNLLYHISNLFILRFENWIPTNNVFTIIQDVKKVVSQFGRIDKESTVQEFSSLEKHLLHLSFITDTKPQCIIIDDFITNSLYSELKTQLMESKKIKGTSEPPTSASAGAGAGNASARSETGWVKGTGYGGNEIKYKEVWDVQKATLLEEERDRTFFTLFDLIHDDIEMEMERNNIDFVYSVIMNSSLMSNIDNYLIQDSLLNKSSIKISSSFKILKKLCSSENLIYLIKSIYPQLYRVYMEHKRIIERSAGATGADDEGFETIKIYYENLQYIITIINSLNLHDKFMDIKVSHEEIEGEGETNEFETKYTRMMQEIVAGELPDLPGYHYRSLIASESSGSLPRILIQRVTKEIYSLGESLPISTSSTIWLRTMEDRFLYAQVMISGPDDTPYSGGLFLFDIYFPNDYPNCPPKVNLQTTGGGKVRFNPNLYNCGKVCLSLLGTWAGDSSEKWIPKVSTLLQVLISIQALILIPEPYFNEPGHQRSIGSSSGQAQSRAYNENIRKQNVRYAIIEQIKNPPRGYEEIVHKHFSLQKAKILKTIEEWKDGSGEWTQLYTEAQTLLNGLPEF